MTRKAATKWRRLVPIGVGVMLLVPLGVHFLLRPESFLGAEKVAPAKFPEELVYVQAEDGVPNCGAIFTPPKDSTKSIVIIWIHGWGVNFYHPTYVMIGRALAGRGYPCISANTRMHDIGFNIGQTRTMRIRGGGYWGLPSEQVLDLAAWIDFAADQGFEQVVLAGHSAGWAAVRRYQSEKQDQRVVGIVLASGAVRPGTGKPDSEMLGQATRLVAEGHGDDLLRIPSRRFPSFISAATFLDEAKTPEELNDFFGIQTPDPAVTRIRCPILAFFGTEGDVGTDQDLELLKSSLQSQSKGPSRVDTIMIQNADHMYGGQEDQVAHTIASWANTLLPEQAGKENETLIDLHDPESVKAHQPLLIAHRGGVVTEVAPENSIPAIELAAERGYSMVEVDIRQTRDGVIVTFHDDNMLQDVGIDNLIEEMTFERISRLRYKGTDERIITLDEYLRHSTKYKMGVMLDIKTTDANRDDDAFFKGIADLIDKYELTKAAVTISREPLAEKYLKGKSLLRINEAEVDSIARGEPVDISGKFWFDWPRFITNEMVELIQEKGCLVMPSINIFHYDVYPEDEREERVQTDIKRMIEAGVDGYQIDGVYDKYFR